MGRVATTGRWQHLRPPIYFHSSLENQEIYHKRVGWIHLPGLISLDKKLIVIERVAAEWFRTDTPLMFDSGIYSILTRLIKAGVSPRDIDLEDVPQWPALLSQLDTVLGDPAYSSLMWGAVEVDFGDWRAKTARRKTLEDRWGIGLMPVFHFGADPWAYLHQLAEDYDRICVSFSARRELWRYRMRWISEVWDRLEGADVWIHELASTPGLEHTLAWGIHSTDSTTWMNVSFDRGIIRAALWPAREGGKVLPIRIVDRVKRRWGDSQHYLALRQLGAVAFDWHNRSLADHLASRERALTP